MFDFGYTIPMAIIVGLVVFSWFMFLTVVFI